MILALPICNIPYIMKRSGSLAANVSKKKDVRKTYNPDPSFISKLQGALTGKPAESVTNSTTSPSSSCSYAYSQSATAASASTALIPESITTPPTFSSDRRAAPTIAPPGRASIQDALVSAQSSENKQQALRELELGKTANSAKLTRVSLWRTYQRLHVAWHGPGVPVLPLSARKIGNVAAMFKAGRYTSYPNYATIAKAEHVAAHEHHGVAWSDELTIAIRDATRSVQRGLGSSKQSMPLDVHLVHKLKLGPEPLTTSGPISPTQFVTLGIFFLAREIEITCAAAIDVQINMDRSEVTWHLPVSKTDQRALGTSRTWGCVCAGDRALSCPFHAACEHFDVLTALAVDLKVDIKTLPLFPSADGTEATKSAAIETIVQLAALTGARTHDAQGRLLFGGHSLRTGGAVALAGLGLDSLKVECLARWHSPMLAHYARLAPLRTLTDEYKLRAQAVDASNNSNLISKKLEALERVVESLKARLDADATPKIETFQPMSDLFVHNTRSNVWHLAATFDPRRSTGTCVCGWSFSEHASDIREHTLPHKEGYAYCERCLPKRRHLAKRKPLASASCSSSTSTSSG